VPLRSLQTGNSARGRVSSPMMTDGSRWTPEQHDARLAFDAFQRSLNYPATVPGFCAAWRAMTGGREPSAEAIAFFRAQVQRFLTDGAIQDWDIDADTADRWSITPAAVRERMPDRIRF
jgi:hypothetical protein